jgi:DNA-binding MarR family transcriptional regulator
VTEVTSNEDDVVGEVDTWPTGRLLSVAARLVERSWERYLAGLDLTHAGLIALHVLCSGELSQRQLAQRCQVTDQTISRTVDRLRQAGYVERAVDERDRRRVTVTVTDAGRKAHATALEAERNDPAVLGTVDDYEALRRQLVQMVTALRGA